MKYQIVLQHSEEDCGAACIATIAKHYGRTFAISRIRETVGTSSRGTTLLGLSRGAEAFGFNARQVKATNQIIDRLSEAPLPAIIHWKGYHWVVLYGKKGKNYVIADPGVGIRYLTRRELIAGWGNGVMLLLTPDDSRFYEQENDKVGGFSRYIQRVWPYRQGKTTITISHRPKVIQRADWIVMLEKGQLKIQGTPEDLHSLTGDHLNFLDDVVPSTKNLVLLPSDSHSHLNGKLSHT